MFSGQILGDIQILYRYTISCIRDACQSSGSSVAQRSCSNHAWIIVGKEEDSIRAFVPASMTGYISHVGLKHGWEQLLQFLLSTSWSDIGVCSCASAPVIHIQPLSSCAARLGEDQTYPQPVLRRNAGQGSCSAQQGMPFSFLQ